MKRWIVTALDGQYGLISKTVDAYDPVNAIYNSLFPQNQIVRVEIAPQFIA